MNLYWTGCGLLQRSENRVMSLTASVPDSTLIVDCLPWSKPLSAELDRIRSILLERREELKKRVKSVKDDIRHTSGPLSSDFAEQAVERENEEVLDALGEAGRVELRQISKALARIDAGDYGTCVTCGEQIPWGRLDVLPFSDQCVLCAEEADSRRP